MTNLNTFTANLPTLETLPYTCQYAINEYRSSPRNLRYTARMAAIISLRNNVETLTYVDHHIVGAAADYYAV